MNNGIENTYPSAMGFVSGYLSGSFKATYPQRKMPAKLEDGHSLPYYPRPAEELAEELAGHQQALDLKPDPVLHRTQRQIRF